MMKVIIAMIQPHRLEAVKHALTENQFNELTVSDVQGFGRQKGRVELYRGAEYLYDYVPKVRLEMAVSKERVPLLIEVICNAAKTGKIGDGKIFIADLKKIHPFRCSESGLEV